MPHDDSPVRNPLDSSMGRLKAIANLLNPVTCWDQLTPEQQRAFGIAGIVHAIGAIGFLNGTEPHQAFMAADVEGLEIMGGILTEALNDPGALPRPDMSVIGIRFCRICGCTERCACGDGCSWIEDDLCSACEGKQG